MFCEITLQIFFGLFSNFGEVKIFFFFLDFTVKLAEKGLEGNAKEKKIRKII